MSTSGLPVRTPCSIVSRTPFSTEGRKFCGIEPPKILSSQTKPVPRGTGAISITQWPYSPAPPDCFLYFFSALALLVIVSWYGTRGTDSEPSTPYLRFIFSSTTSRWTSPMPCTIDSLVMGSCSRVRVGSSSTSLTSAALTFSSSGLFLAPTAALNVCSG